MIDDPQHPSGEGLREGDPRTMPLAGYIADGRICRDLKCCRCGYNLRTLATDAICPECSFPARQSLYHLDLRYADPKWLRRISNGLMLATVVPPVILLLSAVFSGSGSSGYGQTTGWDVSRLATYVLPPWAIGVWGFSMPEPRMLECSRARLTTRATAYLLGGLSLLGIVLPDTVTSHAYAGLTLAAGFLLNAGAMLSYAYQLSRRVHTKQVHDDLRCLLKLGAVVVTVAVTGVGLWLLADLVVAADEGSNIASVAAYAGFGIVFVLLAVAGLIEISLLMLAFELRRFAERPLATLQV